MKITVTEAARLLGVTTPSISRRIESGELAGFPRPGPRHGRASPVLVDVEDVMKLEVMSREGRRAMSEIARRAWARRRAKAARPKDDGPLAA